MAILSYQETVDYLYQNLPIFQRVGAAAYKADLTNTIALCEVLGNPQNKFKSIHIAGTNGKGSSSHMLAAILQTAGYKTGLYTSPHLKEFTERIKINGQEVAHEFVVDFVERIKPEIDRIKPSFFEITVAMAFDYFAQQKVDVAVIEVGLGGRLDSTNVITPIASLITNISWDHKDLLGDTLGKIAFEKAGIIKSNVPVIISERQSEVENVFIVKARETQSKILFADDEWKVKISSGGKFSINHFNSPFECDLDLEGLYQQKNLAGVLATIGLLRENDFSISAIQLKKALSEAASITGLKGRWQKLGERPLMICDTGHNEGGVKEVVHQILSQKFDRLFIVWGSVNDKDISMILSLLPKKAYYFFCQAKIPRALPALELQEQAKKFGLDGITVEDVNDAIARAKKLSTPNDFIFIGGSTFVVAEIDNL
ncbi:MAG: bifunctional folylpolyglutamate synthase/dihydrofolate synthase [Cyclobacteriaceae bacterium]